MKRLAVALFILSICIFGFGVYTYLNGNKTYEEPLEPSQTFTPGTSNESVRIEEQEENTENTENSEESFDDIESVIKYKLADSTQELVPSPSKFDKAFVTFLESEGFIDEAVTESGKTGLVIAKDMDVTTEGETSFEVELQTLDREHIKCIVNGESYDFEYMYSGVN